MSRPNDFPPDRRTPDPHAPDARSSGAAPPESPATNPKFRTEIRVRYHETDGQRRVHHANYLNYFERGRVEMLRSLGLSYKALEDEGSLLVVTEMNVRYLAAAEFDDLLVLTTEVIEVGKVRLWHRYRVERDGKPIVEAESTIACIDRDGVPRRLPKRLIEPPGVE